MCFMTFHAFNLGLYVHFMSSMLTKGLYKCKLINKVIANKSQNPIIYKSAYVTFIFFI